VWTIFFLQLFLCGTHGIYFIMKGKYRGIFGLNIFT
jgi:hypothetical protein